MFDTVFSLRGNHAMLGWLIVKLAHRISAAQRVRHAT
jgi:hypothetical protein